MAKYLSELFFTLVICSNFCVIFASGGQNKPEKIVKPGDNVTLECSVGESEILMVVWVRPDLKKDGYVFFYREGRQYKKFEHPDFSQRVTNASFQDGKMIVKLHSVTEKDSGRYECHLTASGTGRNRRAQPEVISVIDLKVTSSGGGAGHTEDGGDKDGGDKDGGNEDGGDKDKYGGGGDWMKDGGDKDGNIGLKVGLSFVGVLLLLLLLLPPSAVGYLIYRKRIKKLNSDQRPADEDVKEPLKNVLVLMK